MKVYFKINLLIVALFFINVASGQVKYSDLWGKDGEKWDPAGRLPDFSYAGYHTGIKEIPNFPIQASLGNSKAKPNDGIDDADELQKLINTIKTPGTILIPKGVWTLTKRIYIKRSGVVIKGEEGAEFFMPKSLSQIDKENGVDASSEEMNYSFFQAFFNFEGEIIVKKKSGGAIIEDVAQGAKQIKVAKDIKVAVGDWIKITQIDDAQESLYKYVNNITTDRSFYAFGKFKDDALLYEKNMFTFYTKVTAVRGNLVDIERPLSLKIVQCWSPKIEILDIQKTTTEVGLQNVTLRFNGDAWRSHFDNSGFSGIILKSVMNSWIKDVTIIDADNCIYFHDASFCTLDGITIKSDKRPRTKEQGHHGIWLRDSSRDNLITNFNFDAFYLHDLTVESHATQNVFSNGKGIKVNFDHHRISPFANLFTNINVGNGGRLMASSGSYYRGPNSGIYTTLWNITKTSGNFKIPSTTTSEAQLKKSAPDWFYLNAIGVLGVQKAENREQFTEFTNGEKFAPANLHQAQKSKRLSNIKKPIK